MNVRASTVIAVVVALLLAGGLFAAWKLGRPSAVPSTADLGGSEAAQASPDTSPDTSYDVVIERALGQIPATIDSTVIKTGWRDDVRGVDLDAMTTRQRALMLRYANSEMCTCGCGFTLAACRTYDLTCPVSLPRVEALRDSILAGRIGTAPGLREPPASPHP